MSVCEKFPFASERVFSLEDLRKALLRSAATLCDFQVTWESEIQLDPRVTKAQVLDLIREFLNKYSFVSIYVTWKFPEAQDSENAQESIPQNGQHVTFVVSRA